jgi:hypothetical protein
MRGQWVRVGGKRRLDLAADTGFEQRVGDGRDDLVALVAPGGGRPARHHEQCGQKQRTRP